MGLIKGMILLSGVPVRPTTTRERSRGYQREANLLQVEANGLLEDQVRSLEEMNRHLLSAQTHLVQPQPQIASSSPTTIEKLEMIGRLHDLLISGVLTQQEFDSQKQAILKSIWTRHPESFSTDGDEA